MEHQKQGVLPPGAAAALTRDRAAPGTPSTDAAPLSRQGSSSLAAAAAAHPRRPQPPLPRAWQLPGSPACRGPPDGHAPTGSAATRARGAAGRWGPSRCCCRPPPHRCLPHSSPCGRGAACGWWPGGRAAFLFQQGKGARWGTYFIALNGLLIARIDSLGRGRSCVKQCVETTRSVAPAPCAIPLCFPAHTPPLPLP